MKRTMVGLPIDESDDGNDDGNTVNLATRAAEAQLQTRIASLKAQLLAAESALETIAVKRADDDNSSNNTDSKNPSKEADEGASDAWGIDNDIDHKTPFALVSKRGYLFKWMDRSIGWGGK
jgi:hypothetical protein